ncbi:MAG: cyclic pyranopterin monophosphate synthase MoaC [Planctomycetota bacterium]|nr:cyclic pyranopterin monophosphate synthase MoaC [Planctomycetota bacterium]MDA1180434.1 cyclic pyranopterin monophosphate synthase MoaC [Planctomycetota bacterium]
MTQLTHFDDHGASRMVDVSVKPETVRTARATAVIHMAAETLLAVENQTLAKGNVWEVARLAGIQAAKLTPQIIPLCHVVPLSGVQVNFQPLGPESVRVEATVRCVGRTGVEMEALTAAGVAALTVYDMCKSLDRRMTIRELRLEEKEGGKSGHFVHDANG